MSLSTKEASNPEPVDLDRNFIENENKQEHFTTYLNGEFFDKIFFDWITSLVKLNQRKPFEQRMHAKLRSAEKTETQFIALNTQWMNVKKTNSSYRLLRAVFRAYFKELLILSLLGILNALFFFSGPITINLLMQFLAEPNPSVEHIFGLAFAVMILLITPHAKQFQLICHNFTR